MRINRYIAQVTGLSRRGVDALIAKGQVVVNGKQPTNGQDVNDDDEITLSGKLVPKIDNQQAITIILNKPVNYVCSRDGQGSKTVYDLLPDSLSGLKPVGRLDKDSSGLLVMTTDGKLAHELTHPSFQKQKVYEVRLHKDLAPLHHQMIANLGVMLDDGPSRFSLQRMHEHDGRDWQVTMSEGRNRQIRRTFSALDYTVKELHRTKFGNYSLGLLKPSEFQKINT
jgi:23S rRNA pseudouridine2605 synthase